MVLRDLVCSKCGAVTLDVYVDEMPHLAKCDKCRVVTVHNDRCNGGMGTRFRINDFPDDPAFYRGQVTCEAPTAEVAATGETVTHLHSNKPMGEKYKDADRRGERRDRKYHATDRKRGKLPLVFDQKRN